MASDGQGISGIAVAMATAGGVLLYAGFQGKGVVAALKEISTGKASSLPASTVSWSTSGGGAAGGLAAAAFGTGGGPHPEFVQAALRRGNELYSQTKRWADGYSDCSSFVGKVLKDNGITPPGASVTSSYLVWNKLRTISRSEIGAGDLLCGSGHIAIAMSATQAIGQQNGRDNVKVGAISDLMFGEQWTPRRYTGASSGGGRVMAA